MSESYAAAGSQAGIVPSTGAHVENITPPRNHQGVRACLACRQMKVSVPSFIPNDNFPFLMNFGHGGVSIEGCDEHSLETLTDLDFAR